MLDFTYIVGDKRVHRNSEVMQRAPEPMGKLHVAIAYEHFYRAIAAELKRSSLPMMGTMHATQCKGGVYFGITQLHSKNDLYVPVLAWRCSTNQRVSASIYLGTGIVSTGDVLLSNQVHTEGRQVGRFADRLPAFAGCAVTQLPNAYRQQVDALNAFAKTKLTPVKADVAIMAMLRQGVIVPSHINAVIAQWDNPDNPKLMRRYTILRLLLAVIASHRPKGSTDSINSLIERSPRALAFFKAMLVDSS